MLEDGGDAHALLVEGECCLRCWLAAFVEAIGFRLGDASRWRSAQIQISPETGMFGQPTNAV